MANDETTSILDFAWVLMSTSSNQRLAILKHATIKQCNLVREMAYNLLLNSSIKFNDRDRSFLKKHTNSIRRLASKKVCNTEKKSILVQKHLLIKRMAKIVLEYLQ